MGKGGGVVDGHLKLVEIQHGADAAHRDPHAVAMLVRGHGVIRPAPQDGWFWQTLARSTRTEALQPSPLPTLQPSAIPTLRPSPRFRWAGTLRER